MTEYAHQRKVQALSPAPNLLKTLGRALEQPGTLEGLRDAESALLFSARFRLNGGVFLWICRDNREAERIADNLRFFLPSELAEQVLLIPGSEADPYRGLSPHPEIASRRAVGLWKLCRGRGSFLVSTLPSLLARLISPNEFLNQCLHLEVGHFIPRDHLLQKLRESGYMREDPVNEIGEFSYRGGIIDVYSPAQETPVRIEFFGDEIESIRLFDPSTQRSVSMIPGCEIVPMREVIVTDHEIALWNQQAPEFWNQVRFAEALSEKFQFTQQKELFNGFEYVFPLVLKQNSSLFDYLPDPTGNPVILMNPTELWEHSKKIFSRLEESFEDAGLAGDLCLPPGRLFWTISQIRAEIEKMQVFRIETLAEEGPSRHFDFRPERKYEGRLQELMSDLLSWREKNEQVVIVMSSRGMAERTVDIFQEYEIAARLCEGGIEEALGCPVSVTWGPVSNGFYSAQFKIHLLTRDNVYGEGPRRETRPSAPKREVPGTFISDFRDLKEGDHVVHVEHGIGVFQGLRQIGVNNASREFVVLSYQEGARLYVPIDRLDLIQKYSGLGGAGPRVDRLGGVSWQKTKSRIRKSMRDLAEDLLKLYAKRELARGFAFAPDDDLMLEFEEGFEFEETPDQAGAIGDVKKDMESERPMDRLICGDVGYGKTEVAMRAAFKAALAGKQVALLAPTTVLAFQHFTTFRQRFQGFPVAVEMVSRFRSRKEQKEVLEQAALGTVDILIGTHRLLSKDVHFKDLGLLVVDEEQRFGVAQKERLKKLKTQVDVLALSATPIPRTLNMSLVGLRDLSIIETPPKDRLSIQTVVVKFSRNIIRSAIDLELKRQGQAFFVHNSIETINSIARMIQDTVPEARVAVAHGQMGERQLEEIMLSFLNYEYDVLVCTTIIENGLDIPRANTLLVNRADRFGLAQLYQLRGRVGRSTRRAYAFLLIPTEETLSGEARKRLSAIREFSELGAGFRIAALDLEIRGAGNLLGGEQHGHINAVGFELYSKLLEQTVRELKGEEQPEEIQSAIDLKEDIQIPTHYVDDSNTRLWLYKRVSTARDEKGLENLKEEMIDRYGRYPRSVSNLFEYARLRLKARPLRILNIDRKGSSVLIRFRDDTPIAPHALVIMVSKKADLSLSPDGLLALSLHDERASQIFEQVQALLESLTMLE